MKLDLLIAIMGVFKVKTPKKISIEKITPIFDSKKIKKRISPSCGFLDDGINNHFYFGFNLPCELKAKNKDGKKMTLQKNHLVLVKDNHTTLICDNSILNDYRLELKTELLQTRPRWNVDHMGNWLAGDDYTPKIEALEPEELFKKIRTEFEYYLVLPKEEWYDYLTLWCIGTYFFNLFGVYPIIDLYGLKNVGKTKTMDICSYISFNGESYVSITPATLFRIVEANKPSLFLDEIEKLLDPKREGSTDIEAMLNSGYKKGACVPRCEKEGNKQIVKEYDVFCPKMFAHVKGGVSRTLLSRCISLVMQRANPNDIRGDRLPKKQDKRWQNLRNELYIFALENYERILYYFEGSGAIKKEIQIDNRDWELWEPILVLARMVNEDLYKKINSFAEKMTSEYQKEEEESWEYILVKSLKDHVIETRYYFVSEMREWLLDEFENEEQTPTNKSIGWLLKRLGLTDKERQGKGVKWFLSKHIVDGLVLKMGVKEEITTQTPQTPSGFDEDLKHQPSLPMENLSSVVSVVSVENVVGDEGRENDENKSSVVSVVSVVSTDLPVYNNNNNNTPPNETTPQITQTPLKEAQNEPRSVGTVLEGSENIMKVMSEKTPNINTIIGKIFEVFDKKELVPSEVMVEVLKKEANLTEKQAEHIIESKLREGYLFQPKSGFLGRL